MLTVPTALLHHRTPSGSHYDWLIGQPPDLGGPGGLLWAARVISPSRHWCSLGRFDLQGLPPHRRIYLRYEGPISDGRGHVCRVDQGTAVVVLWCRGRIELEVSMAHFRGRVGLAQPGEGMWRATVGAR